MEELLQAQLDAQRAGEPYAVVTIAEASGSVPRKNGKMLVFSDGRTLGTVGGGPAERMESGTRCPRWMRGKTGSYATTSRLWTARRAPAG